MQPTTQPSATPEPIRATGTFTLATLLRLGGALTVFAALAAHLLQGWDLWSGLSRYYVLLGGAALFGVLGLALSFVFDELKGARAFLGLALVTVVATATTLGGFVIDLVNWDPGAAMAPAPAVAYGTHDLLMGAGLLAALIPGIWFVMRVMVGPHAGPATLAFVTATALLLIPLRESAPAGALIALAAVLPALFWWHARRAPQLGTGEGRFTLAALALPAVVMCARLFWLYEADDLLLWVMLALATTLIRGAGRLTAPHPALTHGASALYMIAALALAGQSVLLLEPVLPDELMTITAATIAGLLVWHRGFDYGRVFFSSAGLGLILTGGLLSVVVFDDVSVTLAAGAAAIVVALMAHRERITLLAASGWATLVLTLLPRAWDLLERIDFTHWSTLAVIGLAAMLASSVLERWRATRSVEAESSL